MDIASDVFSGDEKPSFPPFLVLATDGIWDETCPNTVVDEVKDGIAKIQAHKRRFAVRRGKGKHRRDSSFGSTTFTDGESDSEEDASEFCGSGEWAEQGVRHFGGCCRLFQPHFVFFFVTNHWRIHAPANGIQFCSK